MIVTDNFNRADSGDLGANWTTAFASNPGTYAVIGITSNAAKQQGGGGIAVSYCSAVTWLNSQQSTCIIGVSGGTYQLGPMVRCSGTESGFNGYAAIARGNSLLTITRGTNGVFLGGNLLTISGLTIADGDSLTLKAVGTLLSAYQNGNFLNSVTDSGLSSGSPGLYLDNSADTLDNWEGRDFPNYLPRT